MKRFDYRTRDLSFHVVDRQGKEGAETVIARCGERSDAERIVKAMNEAVDKGRLGC